MSQLTAKLLRSNIPKIMQIWEARALLEVKAAPGQNRFSLRDHLPLYLETLADELEMESDQAAKISQVSAEHGRLRAKSNEYTLDQVILEYNILRRVIFEVLEGIHTLTSKERDHLLDSIEKSVSDAATEFTDYLKSLQELFSHTLIHDLRNPLAIAMLCTRLIRPEGSVEENKKTRQRITRNLERIEAMTYRLLEFATLKAGQKIHLNKEEFDLTFLLENLAEDINISGTKQLFIESPKPFIGYWDRNSLRSILENLVSNAIKYGNAGTPVRIRVRPNKEWVQISVHNQGPPIPAEEQKQLFHQFQRARTSDGKPGWGLGLVSAKILTEAHGGALKINPFEENGTTFTVELPRDSRAKIAPLSPGIAELNKE
jgi:signal transduction histidine kinase